jgi:hypothetical protein
MSFSVKLKVTDLKPAKVDPKIWPNIKDDVNDVWVETLPLTSANKPRDDGVSYIVVTTTDGENIILIVREDDIIAQVRQKLRDTGFKNLSTRA